MTKQRAIVICPGRGTYNKEELGYLKRHHSDKTDFIAMVDDYRRSKNQTPVSELDGSKAFRTATMTNSENASPLIYSCALADFQAIDRNKYDIVAVTGNSMGWYLALACAGAVSLEGGIEIVNTMGTLMQKEGVGGQVIYPLVDENWHYSQDLQDKLDATLAAAEKEPGVEVYDSIYLGGMRVLAANKPGIKFLLENLPPVQERYPMQLYNHSAFHSPLLAQIPAMAHGLLSRSLFSAPTIPMVDGRGHIWQPWATGLDALYDYTFGHQIAETYDFSTAIEVAIKEFAPDRLIVLGPGTTLGAPVAQQMIRQNWHGTDSKQTFVGQQKADPLVLAMGIETQRELVVRK